MAIEMDDRTKYNIYNVLDYPSTPNCLKIGPNVPLQAPAPNAPNPTETSFNGFPFSSVFARISIARRLVTPRTVIH